MQSKNKDIEAYLGGINLLNYPTKVGNVLEAVLWTNGSDRVSIHPLVLEGDYYNMRSPFKDKLDAEDPRLYVLIQMRINKDGPAGYWSYRTLGGFYTSLVEGDGVRSRMIFGTRTNFLTNRLDSNKYHFVANLFTTTRSERADRFSEHKELNVKEKVGEFMKRYQDMFEAGGNLGLQLKENDRQVAVFHLMQSEHSRLHLPMWIVETDSPMPFGHWWTMSPDPVFQQISNTIYYLKNLMEIGLRRANLSKSQFIETIQSALLGNGSTSEQKRFAEKGTIERALLVRCCEAFGYAVSEAAASCNYTSDLRLSIKGRQLQVESPSRGAAAGIRNSGDCEDVETFCFMVFRAFQRATGWSDELLPSVGVLANSYADLNTFGTATTGSGRSEYIHSNLKGGSRVTKSNPPYPLIPNAKPYGTMRNFVCSKIEEHYGHEKRMYDMVMQKHPDYKSAFEQMSPKAPNHPHWMALGIIVDNFLSWRRHLVLEAIETKNNIQIIPIDDDEFRVISLGNEIDENDADSMFTREQLERQYAGGVPLEVYRVMDVEDLQRYEGAGLGADVYNGFGVEQFLLYWSWDSSQQERNTKRDPAPLKMCTLLLMYVAMFIIQKGREILLDREERSVLMNKERLFYVRYVANVLFGEQSEAFIDGEMTAKKFGAIVSMMFTCMEELGLSAYAYEAANQRNIAHMLHSKAKRRRGQSGFPEPEPSSDESNSDGDGDPMVELDIRPRPQEQRELCRTYISTVDIMSDNKGPFKNGLIPMSTLDSSLFFNNMEEIRNMLPVEGEGIELRYTDSDRESTSAYTTRDFEMGEIVTEYAGVPVNLNKMKMPVPENILKLMRPLDRRVNYVIIGGVDPDTLKFIENYDSRPLGGKIRVTNDEELANCQYIWIDGMHNWQFNYSTMPIVAQPTQLNDFDANDRMVIVRASRHIEPNEELFVLYSEAQAPGRGVAHRDVRGIRLPELLEEGRVAKRPRLGSRSDPMAMDLMDSSTSARALNVHTFHQVQQSINYMFNVEDYDVQHIMQYKSAAELVLYVMKNQSDELAKQEERNPPLFWATVAAYFAPHTTKLFIEHYMSVTEKYLVDEAIADASVAFGKSRTLRNMTLFAEWWEYSAGEGAQGINDISAGAMGLYLHKSTMGGDHIFVVVRALKALYKHDSYVALEYVGEAIRAAAGVCPLSNVHSYPREDGYMKSGASLRLKYALKDKSTNSMDWINDVLYEIFPPLQTMVVCMNKEYNFGLGDLADEVASVWDLQDVGVIESKLTYLVAEYLHAKNAVMGALQRTHNAYGDIWTTQEFQTSYERTLALKLVALQGKLRWKEDKSPKITYDDLMSSPMILIQWLTHGSMEVQFYSYVYKRNKENAEFLIQMENIAQLALMMCGVEILPSMRTAPYIGKKEGISTTVYAKIRDLLHMVCAEITGNDEYNVQGIVTPSLYAYLSGPMARMKLSEIFEKTNTEPALREFEEENPAKYWMAIFKGRHPKLYRAFIEGPYTDWSDDITLLVNSFMDDQEWRNVAMALDMYQLCQMKLVAAYESKTYYVDGDLMAYKEGDSSGKRHPVQYYWNDEIEYNIESVTERGSVELRVCRTVDDILYSNYESSKKRRAILVSGLKLMSSQDVRAYMEPIIHRRNPVRISNEIYGPFSSDAELASNHGVKSEDNAASLQGHTFLILKSVVALHADYNKAMDQMETDASKFIKTPTGALKNYVDKNYSSAAYAVAETLPTLMCEGTARQQPLIAPWESYFGSNSEETLKRHAEYVASVMVKDKLESRSWNMNNIAAEVTNMNGLIDKDSLMISIPFMRRDSYHYFTNFYRHVGHSSSATLAGIDPAFTHMFWVNVSDNTFAGDVDDALTNSRDGPVLIPLPNPSKKLQNAYQSLEETSRGVMMSVDLGRHHQPQDESNQEYGFAAKEDTYKYDSVMTKTVHVYKENEPSLHSLAGTKSKKEEIVIVPITFYQKSTHDKDFFPNAQKLASEMGALEINYFSPVARGTAQALVRIPVKIIYKKMN